MMLPLHNDSDHGKKTESGSTGCFASAKRQMRKIFEEKSTRNLFLFLLVNLAFAFVELLYGVWSNSLGLISDSFHMFFDCSALIAGLVAALIARKAKNENYTYGYQRAEILGGFVNALFLVFVGLFVLKEALERFLDPPTVHTHRLLLVAVMGLIVNLLGIFAFQHGGDHGHSHGGGHSHSHGHSHGGGGDEGTSNFIMDGVLLHILADTLGSVGVIISSVLIHQYGWMVADPVCSIFIAVMILVSTVPLLRSSMQILMQRTPVKMDKKLTSTYQRVTSISGVVSYRSPHIWALSGSYNVGTIIVTINQGSEDDIRARVRQLFTEVGVNEMVIEIEHFQ